MRNWESITQRPGCRNQLEAFSINWAPRNLGLTGILYMFFVATAVPLDPELHTAVYSRASAGACAESRQVPNDNATMVHPARLLKEAGKCINAPSLDLTPPSTASAPVLSRCFVAFFLLLSPPCHCLASTAGLVGMGQFHCVRGSPGPKRRGVDTLVATPSRVIDQLERMANSSP